MRGRGDVLEEGHNRFLTLIVLKLAVVWTATRIDYTEVEKDQGRVKTGGNKTKQKKSPHQSGEKSHHVSVLYIVLP